MRSLFPSLLVVIMFCWSCTSTTEKTQDNTQVATSKAVLVQIHDPHSQTVTDYSDITVTGSTKVRDVLGLTAQAHPDFTFTDTAYIGMGHLLTSINGVRNAKGEGAYWQFCIDNVASNKGIDEMEVAPGQTLSWHYAEYGKLPCKKIGE
jgi:hypothetical protein